MTKLEGNGIEMDAPFLLDKFIQAYKSLNEREKCIFDHYLSDKFANYTYLDIASICWPERDKPVTVQMVCQEVKKIRIKFENIFFDKIDDFD